MVETKSKLKGKRSSSPFEWIFRLITRCSALVVLVLMAALFVQLLYSSIPSIKKFGLSFLISTQWNPVTQDFGALSSIYGTLITTFIAMLLAAPLACAIALFLVEMAPPAVSAVVGQAIDLLAAIPSIIYGMWGLFVLVPFMQEHVQPILGRFLGFTPLFKGPPLGIGVLTSGVILALMILPFIAAVMRDVFRMVPPVVKESAYGLGSTTWEVTHKVTVKYGLQGILGGLFLGLGRAIGETMAVTFVIGNSHKLSASLFASGNSIASTLANEFAEAVSQPMFKSSLMELGLVLFLVTFTIQIFAQLWLNKVRKSAGRGL